MNIEELGTAWEECKPRIRAALRRRGVALQDAEDVEQEAFLKVSKSLDRPSLSSARDVGAVIAKAAIRVWLDQFVRRPRPETKPDDFWEDWSSRCAEDIKTVDPVDEVIQRETGKILSEAVALLDESLATILERRVVDRVSVREIAARLDLSVAQVRWRYEKALRLVREKVE